MHLSLYTKNICLCDYTQENTKKKKAYLQLGADRQTLLFKNSRHQFGQQSWYSALNFYILLLMQTKLGALKIDAAT